MVYSSYKKQRILCLYFGGYKPPTIAKLLREEGMQASRRGVDTVAVKKKFTFSYHSTIVLRRIRSIKTEEKRSKNVPKTERKWAFFRNHRFDGFTRNVLKQLAIEVFLLVWEAPLKEKWKRLLWERSWRNWKNCSRTTVSNFLKCVRPRYRCSLQRSQFVSRLQFYNLTNIALGLAIWCNDAVRLNTSSYTNYTLYLFAFV